MNRRTATLSLAATLALPRLAQAVMPASIFATIERDTGGRLGVAALDTGSGRRLAHRGDERFPMCSTFKFLAAAAILARVDAGEEHLTRRVVFGKGDLVQHSPVAEKYADDPAGMTVSHICEAAMLTSDNTAGNLMLSALGGPPGITAFARRLGDAVTRLDRIETELNEALPGDPRDTTSPNAMADNLQKLVLGDGLKSSSRDQVTAWLRANRTGAARIRAGVPSDWQVGEKTGTGARGTNNDVGVIWPPGRAPIVLTVYLTGAAADFTQQNAAIAAATRAVAAELA